MVTGSATTSRRANRASGIGLQWSDRADSVNGGNCYACHQLTKEEISFGNIGPSLYATARNAAK